MTSIDFAYELADKALLCMNEERYIKAAELQAQATDILSKLLSPSHEDVSASIHNLAFICSKLKRYEEAEQLYLWALELKEKTFGSCHPSIANTLSELAQIHQDLGRFDKAEPLYQQSLLIREKALGPDHEDTERSLRKLGDLYWEQKLYVQSEPYRSRILAIHVQKYGIENPHTANSLCNLAGVYRFQCLYEQAEALYKQALEINEKTLGLDHLDTHSCRYGLACLYREMGLYDISVTLLRNVLEKREFELGPKNPNTAACIVELASTLEDQGLYGEAEELYARALEAYIDACSPRHPDTAKCLHNLAGLYHKQLLYSKAEKLYNEALLIRKQVFGDTHPTTANTIHNLACLYHSQGLLAKAEEFERSALEISERVYGPSHRITAYQVDSLAAIVADKGFSKLAEELFQRAYKIRLNIHGLQHPMTVSSLNNLANFYSKHGDSSKAEVLYEEAVVISEKLLGENHPKTAITKCSLAGIYSMQGLYSKAELLLAQSIDALVAAKLAPTHPYLFGAVQKLSWLYFCMGNYADALDFYAASFQAKMAWIARELSFLPRMMRVKLFESQCLAGDILPFESVNISPQFGSTILYVSLNLRGFLLDLEQRQAALAKLPGEHQPLVTELQSMAAVLSSSQLVTEHRRLLAEQRDELEQQLYRLYPELELKTVEVADVAAALPADAALIDIQRYEARAATTPIGDAVSRYIAFILFRNERIEAVELGLADSIDTAIKAARADTLADDPDAGLTWSDLSEQLLAPLLPHLQGVQRWYLSLDGELHRVPFHVLPLPGAPDTLLVETLTLQLLTSGRDLLIHQLPSNAPSSMADAMVVADPAFDHAPVSPEQASQDLGDHQPRSRDMGALKAWAPLPNSAIEGQQISQLLGASLHTGSHATTITVQQAQRPRVLHIATHGFFLPDQSEPQERQSWMPLDGHDLLARFRGEDPMLRSGLVFAGANHPVADPSEDDGYLTAQEAVHLDLQGTELVTLSACDAGSGDIRTGEGVYGLQRALIVAGARSMLLSLWPVPDAATCEFMVRFYTLLKQGAGRFEALVAVQRQFRQHDNVRWRHPYYWGAWQLIGDGGPIANL